MGKHFTLTADDSHQLGAYRADPAGASKGGVVVIQEIFGVNQHIRHHITKVAPPLWSHFRATKSNVEFREGEGEQAVDLAGHGYPNTPLPFMSGLAAVTVPNNYGPTFLRVTASGRHSRRTNMKPTPG